MQQHFLTIYFKDNELLQDLKDTARLYDISFSTCVEYCVEMAIDDLKKTLREKAISELGKKDEDEEDEE